MISVAVCCAVLASIQLPGQATYPWDLPSGFPPPTIPSDNLMSEATVRVGQHLFYYDTRF
jgi:cytochrome c peroxidase